MIPRELRFLMRKELRQLLRSRGALATALLLPILFLLIIPGLQIIAFTVLPSGTNNFNMPSGSFVPGGLAAIGNDPKGLLRVLLLPMFTLISGLVMPSITANYTMVAEREARTIELLVALPVRIGQILLAKLLVIVGLGGAVILALFVIDAILIVALGVGSFGYVLLLLLLLLAALAYSTASALLISLLAKDFRTANNFSGALLGPTILLAVSLLIFVPGSLAPLLLAAIFALAAVAATLIALRVVTFERLLR